LGGETVAGGKMKTTGVTKWNTPNSGATNESGFTGMPGGYYSSGGTFGSVGSDGWWWSATELISTMSISRNLVSANYTINNSNADKQFGFSVRCVRD